MNPFIHEIIQNVCAIITGLITIHHKVDWLQEHVLGLEISGWLQKCKVHHSLCTGKKKKGYRRLKTQFTLWSSMNKLNYLHECQAIIFNSLGTHFFEGHHQITHCSSIPNIWLVLQHSASFCPGPTTNRPEQAASISRVFKVPIGQWAEEFTHCIKLSS